MDSKDQIKETEEEFKKKIEKIEEDAGKNILNHFNRIHDKLFTANNIFIAGYFTLSRVYNINILVVIIPLVNLIFLIYIEYLMMEKSRKEYDVGKMDLEQFINFTEKKDKITNKYSLFSIVSTFCVFVYFIYLLLYNV